MVNALILPTRDGNQQKTQKEVIKNEALILPTRDGNQILTPLANYDILL